MFNCRVSWTPRFRKLVSAYAASGAAAIVFTDHEVNTTQNYPCLCMRCSAESTQIICSTSGLFDFCRESYPAVTYAGRENE